MRRLAELKSKATHTEEEARELEHLLHSIEVLEDSTSGAMR